MSPLSWRWVTRKRRWNAYADQMVRWERGGYGRYWYLGDFMYGPDGRQIT